ncbi:unnamed protein product [Pleuronectes platessa]|uniref:Uncharacterized protein n=1 Tax=Pleuronectes platessa TaxID=8262 RepID=A0A9N7U8B6_PLEPL|nr:unnamed protein product [Pleuronectes platessa]
MKKASNKLLQSFSSVVSTFRREKPPGRQQEEKCEDCEVYYVPEVEAGLVFELGGRADSVTKLRISISQSKDGAVSFKQRTNEDRRTQMDAFKLTCCRSARTLHLLRIRNKPMRWKFILKDTSPVGAEARLEARALSVLRSVDEIVCGL